MTGMYEAEIARLKNFYEQTMKELNNENQVRQRSLEQNFNKIKKYGIDIKMKNEENLKLLNEDQAQEKKNILDS